MKALTNNDTTGDGLLKPAYLPGAILPFNDRIVAFYGNLYSKDGHIRRTS